MIRKLIGDRAFYRKLLTLSLPIMLQSGITNFVNTLDNVMIGSVGTAQMTGVAISNQLLFVFNLCIFGIVSGAGIFGAQFFGSGDQDGVRHTFRFKLISGIALASLGIALFVFADIPLLKLYIQEGQQSVDSHATLLYATEYLHIMLFGLIPYAITQSYCSTLREAGRPTPPMIAGVIAVCTNLVLNYVLIFGKFGIPALGVKGAAIATVLSRFTELAILVCWTHAHTRELPFVCGIYGSLHLPKHLVLQLIAKGFPLMLNETLWAAGVAALTQCYSTHGLDTIAAYNISQTFWNVFAIGYLAIGVATSIIVGQLLGADQLTEAKTTAYKLAAVAFALSCVVSLVYIVCAEFIPLAYNAGDDIRHMATRMMQITAIAMPFDALAHSAYYTLRSGGKIMITFLFDSGFMWAINFVVAFILCNCTALPILAVFAIVQGLTALKAVCGIVLLRNGFWVKNIVN